MPISRRWNAGASALGSGPTALAKTRRPSAAVSRAATPGEKPVGYVTARTISLPSQRSTSLPTRRGRSVQSSLAPRSGGGCRCCITRRWSPGYRGNFTGRPVSPDLRMASAASIEARPSYPVDFGGRPSLMLAMNSWNSLRKPR